MCLLCSAFYNYNCWYNMIFGTSFLSKTCIRLNYDRGEMLWCNSMLPILLGQDWLELYATEILVAKYQLTDVWDVVENQHHLTAHQKCDLLDVLKRHQKLFDSTLGVYLHKICSHQNWAQCKTCWHAPISHASNTPVHVQTWSRSFNMPRRSRSSTREWMC